jgi:hypothetical protein
MGRNVSILVAGVVTIGIITALVLPGRTTAASAKGFGDASSHLLSTAISGKS